MEYLIGSLITILGMLVISKISKKTVEDTRAGKYRVVYNQSHVYKILRPYILLDSLINKEDKRTQVMDYEDSMYVRVMVVDDQAYWIKDNTFFTADMVDNNLDNESTRTVDTMGMDDVQLKKMMFIVDKLTEGTPNDRGDSGYSWI